MGTEDPLRVAPPAEAEEVARLLAAFRSFYGADEPSDEEMLAVVRRLIGTPDTEYLLAGDPAAGVAQIRYRLSVWTGAEDCWVEDVFVEEEARGQGLGRRLIEGCVAARAPARLPAGPARRQRAQRGRDRALPLARL